MKSLPPYEQWQPYGVAEVSKLRKGVDWILAGGNALKLFLNKTYRQHADIDILVQRSEQRKIIQSIDQQKLFVATSPGSLTPYDTQEYYNQPIQDIWCLNAGDTAWALQIMLFDVVDNNWVYKRNPAITLPLSQIYFKKEGIKALRPEIQLLYKSKSIRSKDQLDFEMVVPHLNKEAKSWLKDALSVCYDKVHAWSLYL
ncbi:hypothetical protein BKI52_33425 [marine bacterium AO1-C]|nr:hypothetical protein BKI52_33425 [marine bacterium AO1-C]